MKHALPSFSCCSVLPIRLFTSKAICKTKFLPTQKTFLLQTKNSMLAMIFSTWNFYVRLPALRKLLKFSISFLSSVSLNSFQGEYNPILIFLIHLSSSLLSSRFPPVFSSKYDTVILHKSKRAYRAYKMAQIQIKIPLWVKRGPTIRPPRAIIK